MRDNNKGGGLCVGITCLDQSVMVDFGDNAQFHLYGTNTTFCIRLISAYGPKENELDFVKDIFYQILSL